MLFVKKDGYGINLLHSQTVQEILERLDESYNRFFKKLAKRPPKFKSPEKFNSFVFKQGGFTLNGNDTQD